MNIHADPAIFAGMTELRDQQLAWLENITSSTRLTLTDIARRARLDPSTLTRFRSKNDAGHTLTARTVKKIEDATGVPAYEVRSLRPDLRYFNEDEAEIYIADDNSPDPLVSALRDIITKSNDMDLWRLKTPALSACGYQEGDIVVVDRSVAPRAGDAVLAQKVDWRRGTTETIFRVYRAPYLLTAINNGSPGLPDIVDDENVVIKGVVIGGCHLRG